MTSESVPLAQSTRESANGKGYRDYGHDIDNTDSVLKPDLVLPSI